MSKYDEAQAKRYAQILGKSLGAATGELKKNLLFFFAHRLGMGNCYRCKKPIETVEEFSIEHKKGWRFAKDPKATFYDLRNIAFSHLDCNVSYGKPHNKKFFTNEERRVGRNAATRNWWFRHHEKNKIRHRGHAGQRRSNTDVA